LEIVSLLLSSWTDASKEKDIYSKTPLHSACDNGASLELVSLLLKSWPGALKEKTTFGATPLHLACRRRACLELVSLILGSWGDAVKEKDSFGATPLHLACENGASLEVVSLILANWPGASKEKNHFGELPINKACKNKAPFQIILLLLDKWLEDTEHRNIHDVESLKFNASEDVKKLLSHVSSLFIDEVNNNIPSIEIKNFFVSINWSKGLFMVINKYSSTTKTLDLHINVMADFLSVIGKCCSLTTMWQVVINEQELLKGA